MNKRTLCVSVLTLLFTSQVTSAFSQTVVELNNFLSQRLGLSQNQITAIQHGKAFATNVKPRNETEVFLFGVIWVDAVPDHFLEYAGDLSRAGHLPGHDAVRKFSNPPQLSDLQGFGLDNDDVKALKDCKPGDCKVQIPVSTAMDELRRSVNWSAPDVNDEVNQILRKLALSRIRQYQTEGDRIFGLLYNSKGQQVNVK